MYGYDRQKNTAAVRKYRLTKKGRESHQLAKTSQYRRDPGPFKRRMAKYIARVKAGVAALLGNKCARCGFTDSRALQIDHILGGGNLERQAGLSIQKLRIWILANPEDAISRYQILCANCNWIKRAELGETR